MPRKPDAEEIKGFLDSLPKALGLDAARKWWPKYVFHSAHVENAAGILNDDQLLPRARVEGTEKLVKDSAAADLVADLPGNLRHLVRLYFRPRTPTQYRNQGVRPRKHLYQNAHMPVPVYLLFDAAAVLGEVGVGFTRGRLTTHAEIGYDAPFFTTIPFRDVYHDSGVGQLGGSSRRSEILNARHAEALVPDALALENLKYIVCRSGPERGTLLCLLAPEVRERWQQRIIAEGTQRLFFKDVGTFVESASLDSEGTQFSLYTGVPPDWRGPFHLEIAWQGPSWNPPPRVTPEFSVNDDPLAFRIDPPRKSYEVAIRMDGNLVYRGRWEEPEEAEVLF